jgi:putative ABC transport system substrate-binding protein
MDATKTIPFVFSNAGDPVQSGLVTSLNRPNGNITGISYMSVELGAKRLVLLHELKPAAARFAVLVNPSSVDSRSLSSAVEVAAAAAGWDLQVLSAATTAGIDNAFAQLTETRIAALLVMPNILFGNRRVHLATLAARHAVPTIYPDRQYTEVGGLMSYGTRLKGEKPSDLPVLHPTKFELVINLQTAKIIGVTVPPTLLAIADEVIE